MQYQFGRFKVAAVQAAPVYLDRDKTTEKACDFIKKAASEGAKLIAFPETYIPGYPHWVWLDSPGVEDKLFPQLVKNAVSVPSAITDTLCQAARENNIYVAIGINETSRYSFAEIFNTMLLLGPDGKIMGRHRKIVPTYAEKLVWSFGDGMGLRTYDSQIGRLGMLICGENTNSLARFALIAQAEQVHISSYPAFPQKTKYDLRKAIEIRSAAHSFEGKVFNIVSSSLIDDRMREILGDTDEKKTVLANPGNGFTGVIGPNGEVIGKPVPEEEEGIAYAEIDLESAIKWKMFHDISGNYNRFDIVSLKLDKGLRRPIIDGSWGNEGEALTESRLEIIRKKLNEIDDDDLRTDLLALLKDLFESMSL